MSFLEMCVIQKILNTLVCKRIELYLTPEQVRRPTRRANVELLRVEAGNIQIHAHVIPMK